MKLKGKKIKSRLVTEEKEHTYAVQQHHMCRKSPPPSRANDEWIKCSLVAIALNNNLRISKFRAEMSTYYMRAFIKRFIRNYFSAYIQIGRSNASKSDTEMHTQRHWTSTNEAKKKFNKKAKSIQCCRCCLYLICGVVVFFFLPFSFLSWSFICFLWLLFLHESCTLGGGYFFAIFFLIRFTLAC